MGIADQMQKILAENPELADQEDFGVPVPDEIEDSEDEKKVDDADDSQHEDGDADTDDEAEIADTTNDEEDESDPEDTGSSDLKPDNAAMARMRREAAAEKRKVADLEKQIEELKKNAAAKPEEKKADVIEDPEPDKDDVEAHLRWENRQLRRDTEGLKKWRSEQQQLIETQQQERQYQETVSKAIQNFSRIEQDFSEKTPDYEDASAFMVQKMAQGVQAIYPMATKDQITQFVNNQILSMADGFAQQSLNPVEELYHMAKERYGFTGKKEDAPVKKASISTIAANKRRSISALSGGGNSKNKIDLKGMTPAKLERLTLEERAELGMLDE